MIVFHESDEVKCHDILFSFFLYQTYRIKGYWYRPFEDYFTHKQLMWVK